MFAFVVFDSAFQY